MLITRLPPTYHQCRATQVRQHDWLRLGNGAAPIEVARVRIVGCCVVMELDHQDGRLLPYRVTVDAVLDRMDRR